MNKMKKRGKSAGNTKKRAETRLRMRALKGSTLPTFCTTTIVRKKSREKSAHAHAITSGSTTTANLFFSVTIYY